MKTYQFHSALPPQRVTARLKRYEGRVNGLDDGATSVEFLKDGSFYLLQTPSNFLRNRRAAYPFHGTIEAEETGSRITGQFGLRKKARRFSVGLLMVLIFLLELCFGFWETPGLAILFLILSATFFSLCITLESRIGSSGQRRETLRFIEEHLLQE